MIENKYWWKNIINKLLSKPESAVAEMKELEKSNPEIVEVLDQVKVFIKKKYIKKSYFEKVVNRINDQVLQYALKNYFYKIELTNENDLFDSMITSLNMLGEEINYSTVSRQYLTDIFNTIPQFIIVVDEKGIIQTVNNNILVEIGELNENLLQTNICSLFLEKLSLKELENSADNNTILTLKHNKNSNNISVTIKTSKFVESNHKHTRIVFILSDLTETIRYQQELENKNIEVININKNLKEALNNAEQSDRLKSAFLANMSHEIRTPMNGILGFAGLLKEPGLSGEEQQEYIGIIEKAGDRMLNIINDIVSISKIEAGLMEVNMQESNINEQMEYIYTFFKPEIEAKGMQFLFHNSLPLKECSIKTDREKVFAILTNLVKNAIKYSEKGSIELGYYLKDNFIEFYVKDTGIGVPNDRQAAIFERFIQADIADKKAFQGAGLGLSISKAFVEMLGGDIWVESEEGKGSCFYFTLPYQNETIIENIVENKISSAEEDITSKQLKILIAEDDEVSKTLLSIYVIEYSSEIISVRTGTQAVSKCLNNPDIDLILMDLQMPEMDGCEAVQQIRKFNKDVIIIAQTAFGLAGDREKSIAAGCSDYIAKPFNKMALKQMIDKHLKR